MQNMGTESPSYPMENGQSPFLDLCNDAIDSIFRTMSANGEKQKMRMELVCAKFSNRIKQRPAWKGEKKLELGQHELFILINGHQFPFDKAPMGLSKLCDRLIVEQLVIYDMVVLSSVRLSLCHTISQHQSSINLKSIQMLSTFDYDGSLMCAIAGCGLDGVKRIECGDWEENRDVKNFPFSYYSLVSQCHNLETFVLVTSEISLIWEYLLPALANCPHLSKLCLDDKQDQITHRNAIEFGQYCTWNFPKLKTLWMKPVVSLLMPVQYLTSYGEQFRANLVSFGITLDSRLHAHRQITRTICNWFPNLRYLNIDNIGGRFHTDVVLETIGNIFATFRGRGAKGYKLELKVAVKNSGTLLSRLAQKKWNVNDEFTKIEASNGVWMCVNHNVQIIFNFNNDSV